MLVETHVFGEIFARRYPGPEPRYAIVVSHGIGGHGGTYDGFCAHHATKGVDVWTYDAPGHGLSTRMRPRGRWTLTEWVKAAVSCAEHVKAKTGLPVFMLGSSLGVAASFSALYSEAVAGAVLMGGPVIPSTPMMVKRGAPWRTQAVEEMLNSLGRAARLDVGLLFNFDEDYGYPGAAALPTRSIGDLVVRPRLMGEPLHLRTKGRRERQQKAGPSGVRREGSSGLSRGDDEGCAIHRRSRDAPDRSRRDPPAHDFPYCRFFEVTSRVRSFSHLRTRRFPW